jgi:glycosyltransferase involved in cell wall biosynthesis
MFLGEGRLTITEISSIYAAADVLAFTSVDEGFGFPLIEAMDFGLPIVDNRRTSIPKIVGDAAIFASDPFDPDELYNAIKRRLTI